MQIQDKDWKNVFQLWEENGKQLPFKVRRWTWYQATYFLVTEVVIKKWPYGKAYGHLYMRGERQAGNYKYDSEKKAYDLGCAGNYQWEIVGGQKQKIEQGTHHEVPFSHHHSDGYHELEPNESYG